jgi:hypothetical protein
VVAVNFVAEPRGWSPPAGRDWVVDVSSATTPGREGAAFDGILAPDEAVVLRPA